MKESIPLYPNRFEMNTIEAKKNASIRIRKGLYERVRERAKEENRSVSNFLETLIREAVESREPNEETKAALDQAIRDMPYQGYKKYRDTEDLFKDLMKDDD